MVVEKLSDYKVLDYFTKHIDLTIDLTQSPIESRALLHITPNPNVKSPSTDLQLDCENMELTSVLLNGKLLTPEQYERTENALIIKNAPQGRPFTIETTSRLGKNTDLFGYYETEEAGQVTGLVKAETRGMRRVLPCQDRPDCLSTYTTTIRANKNKFPTLLANGVEKSRQDISKEVQEVIWEDQIPKPTYLFAMVAGNLIPSSTSHTTISRRKLPIHFYVPKEDAINCTFAQKVLKAAMVWDEIRFSLECPLPQYMVAGVNQYASGASETSGLTLFNTANLFATPASRTDVDFMRVLDVVAHEYFHTWTGNMVTIRDWFNLSVKEGLTTFRAALFLESMLGMDLDRMFDGRSLDERAPRPDSYISVRSLYTTAAYEKSGEIFRMIMKYLGEEIFNKGLSDFLIKNKGKAVTLEDVLAGLSNHCHKDVRHFITWFTESGTPTVKATAWYDKENKTYCLGFNVTGDKKRPIPITVALYDKNGNILVKPKTYMLENAKAEIKFPNIPNSAIPSLLRGFSAPVNFEFTYLDEELLFLIRHDDDLYNKCKSAKKLFTRMIEQYCAGTPITLSEELIDTFRALLGDPTIKPWVLAELLTIPSEEALITSIPTADFEKIAMGRLIIQQQLALELKPELENKLTEIIINKINRSNKKSDDHVVLDMNEAGNRRLKAVCNSYLLQTEPKVTTESLVLQFNNQLGKNMTETISALTLLADANFKHLNDLLERFYEHWKHDMNAINYWLNVQASAHSPEVINMVRQLMKSEVFNISNPNRVLALFGPFIKNPYGFHALSGEGYQLVADTILEIESINPTLAANLTEKFNTWNKCDKKRQEMMYKTLQHIHDEAKTPDVKDMAKKGLEMAPKAELPLNISTAISHTLLGGAPAAKAKEPVPKPAPIEDNMEQFLKEMTTFSKSI